MYLVQLLLPLNRNDGEQQPPGLFDDVRRELVERFGGLTAYTRSPAEGLWSGGEAHPARDDVVILEVVCDRLDHGWWNDYRGRLEVRFEQQSVLVRALPIVLL